MAINKNHLFEELDGVKCAVVETNVPESRAQFLKSLLELNGYTVILAPEAAAKTVAPPPPPVEPMSDPAANPAPQENIPPPPVTYKVGVTDVSFNSINAIYGRLLKTKSGRVVTMAYWLQKETESNDDVPYFDFKT